MGRNFKAVRGTKLRAFAFWPVVVLLAGACGDNNPGMDRGAAGPVAVEVPDTIWEPAPDSAIIAANAEHPNPRMRFRLIESRVSDKEAIFRPLYAEAMALGEARYGELLPRVLGRTIPDIQQQIREGAFSYEELTRFFLYRIYKFELDPLRSLNTILALNPRVIEDAREKDQVLELLPDAVRHPMFGMPILLKDNIDTGSMPTTAGAAALKDSRTGDAFIVDQLRMNGAIVLGKVNLSEWAYYFCGGCPVGYSAVGGQTLNPYGRGRFETGGSSSGSGTSVAAGYAIGAVGTETSGSILSPSGQNSVAGLKPTTGLLSRTGIVPISSTLDTPGPMARSVVDAAILLDAMQGYDMDDPASIQAPGYGDGRYRGIDTVALAGKRLGVFQNLLESDSLYRAAVDQLAAAGAEIIAIDPPSPDMDGFLALLDADMKKDLPAYLATRVLNPDSVPVSNAADVIAFNLRDTLVRAPYGQSRLAGVAADTTNPEALSELIARIRAAGHDYFTGPWKEFGLDAVLSVNNRHAQVAAAANYPALCLPMGYRENGEPAGLTIIVKSFQEKRLLELGFAFEQLGHWRQMPGNYID